MKNNMPEPLVINGKTYPLWQQFIDKKEKWIGGTLEDFGGGHFITKITDIVLRENGKENAFFEVEGK